MLEESQPERASEFAVLLADDHLATRAGIRGALEPHGIRVVAEAATAEDAVSEALAHRPDICVIEVLIPGNGIQALRQISAALPAVKIVVLTASDRDEDMFSSLRAGADGYLLKTMSIGGLADAIRSVARGEAALSREMTARLIREFRDGGRPRRLQLSVGGDSVELTSREFEVVQRLRRQMRTSEMATELGISEITVRRHVSAIMQKLRTSTRSGVIELLERTERCALEDEMSTLEPRVANY
jgi:two-component system nitrate/nitrite response regulator NarL